MSFTLRKFQQDAVDDMVTAIRKSFERHAATDSKVIVLDAPTGSGKTVMLGKVIDEALQGALTIVLGPGAGDLETQTCNRLQSVCKTVTVKELNSTVLSTPAYKGLAVVSNWEALTTRDKATGKYKVALTKDQEGVNLFDWVGLASTKGIPVVIVIDEAHHGATKAAAGIQNFLSDLSKVLVDPETKGTGLVQPLVIEASATPLRTDASGVDFFEYIKVSHRDAISEGLLRKKGALNAGVRELLAKMPEDQRGGIGAETVLLQGAYNRLQLIDKAYEAAGSNYHGLMVIQIPNLKAGNEAIERAKRFFRQYDITEENGKLAVFTSANKTGDLTNIASPDSDVKVLLYKQAIATGWDCPRAQVLVGFRHLKSRVFTLQNLGRICRTTEAKHYGDDILDTFYIYSNASDLGLGLFGDAVIDGMADYTAWADATTEYVTGFNNLHLPQTHYKRTSRSPVDAKMLRSAMNDAFVSSDEGVSFKSAYRFVDMSEIEDSLYEITKDTEDLLNGAEDGDPTEVRHKTKKVGKSSEELARELLDKIESVVTENGRDFGANSRLAEGIRRMAVRWMVNAATQPEGALYSAASESRSKADSSPAHDWNDWAAGQLLANFAAFKRVINQALSSPDIQALATDKTAKAEDAMKRETREFAFLGSYTLPASVSIDRVDDKKVSPRLAPYYLYHAERANGEGPVEAWRHERLSGQEQAFEDNFLTGMIDRDPESLVWFYKNPARNTTDFCFGITSGESAINFFPDYIMAYRKDGKVVHAILEVKPPNLTGSDPHALDKAKAALAYSENTGIPVAVVHQTTDGQWRVAGTDSVTTLRDFLFQQEWTAQALPVVPKSAARDGAPVPAGLEWLKGL